MSDDRVPLLLRAKHYSMGLGMGDDGMIVVDVYGKPYNAPFIKDGKCYNHGEYICNLGYACDGCPFNKEEQQMKSTRLIDMIRGKYFVWEGNVYRATHVERIDDNKIEIGCERYDYPSHHDTFKRCLYQNELLVFNLKEILKVRLYNDIVSIPQE